MSYFPGSRGFVCGVPLIIITPTIPTTMTYEIRVVSTARPAIGRVPLVWCIKCAVTTYTISLVFGSVAESSRVFICLQRKSQLIWMVD